jgi:phosphate transport system substrate-binding protein
MHAVTQKLAGALLTGAVALSLFGCGGSSTPPTTPPTTTTPGTGATQPVEGTITASGSTALLPLAMAAKEQFETKNDKATVNVAGGGSGNGLSQVASGAVNIGNSDVEPTGEPAKAGLVDHKVAVAPMMLIVSKDVTATDLTSDQVGKIFKGEIKDWKDVGGKAGKISVVSRQNGSGTRGTFVSVFMGGKDATPADAIVMDSTGKVLDAVAGAPGSIGYIDAPYFDANKVGGLKIDGVAYAPEAVTGGKWKFFAYEHMYTKGEATGATKAFIDFMMSKEFQDSSVEKMKFIPVSKMAK